MYRYLSVAGNDPRRVVNIKGKRLIRIGGASRWSQGSFIASVANAIGSKCSVLAISYRHMDTVQYVSYSRTGDETLGIEIYKRVVNGVLEVFIYSTTDPASINPMCGLSTNEIAHLGETTDLSGYTLVASL